MTTDTKPKMAQATIRHAGRTCRVAGIAKGSGMIHPNMANHYRKEVSRLVGSLQNANHSPEACDVLRSLIEKIVLSPNKDGTELAIDLADAREVSKVVKTYR